MAVRVDLALITPRLSASMRASIAESLVAVAPEDPDASILTAWNTRQTALSIIEFRGPYWRGEIHSPLESDVLDSAEMVISRTPAASIRGVLAKLWVTLSFSVPYSDVRDGASQKSAILRAAVREIEAFADDFDLEQKILFHAIRDLTKIVEDGRA